MLTNFITKTFYYMTYSPFPCRLIFNRHGGKDGVRSTESRSTESRSTESRSTESRSTESRSTESRSTESRSTESRSTESRSTESRSHGVRSHGVRSLFMLYLLQFCPGQTSTCFGCGNPLKQGTAIPDAPNDLVVVSKMPREWMFQGRTYSKVSNVYFHCATACILRKQPNFGVSSCFVAPQIEPYLLPLHRDYIRMNLGIHC